MPEVEDVSLDADFELDLEMATEQEQQLAAQTLGFQDAYLPPQQQQLSTDFNMGYPTPTDMAGLPFSNDLSAPMMQHTVSAPPNMYYQQF